MLECVTPNADGNYGDGFDAMEIATGGNLDPGVAFERAATAIPEPGT